MGVAGNTAGNNESPEAFKKLLLLTGIIRVLLLPNYEDWASHRISPNPGSRSFIRKLTFKN
jgi:hypothetical protein